jgi:hypothetical protein
MPGDPSAVPLQYYEGPIEPDAPAHRKLMLSSQELLMQISLTCGMCDQARFSRMSRRIVGINPRA